MTPLRRAEKVVNDGEFGKTGNWCQTRKNTHIVLSACTKGAERLKHATLAKSTKTCNWCMQLARENAHKLSENCFDLASD